MSRALSVILAGAAASVLVANLAVAVEMQEVVVSATRMLVETPAGRTSSGIPLIDISLSYGVSYAGLDLATHSGAMELEKRVHEAAKAACEEISHQRPLAHLTPSDSVCAKTAAEKAMVKVDELVAAAEKKGAK